VVLVSVLVSVLTSDISTFFWRSAKPSKMFFKFTNFLYNNSSDCGSEEDEFNEETLSV
jgi:hypothetical protein